MSDLIPWEELHFLSSSILVSSSTIVSSSTRTAVWRALSAPFQPFTTRASSSRRLMMMAVSSSESFSLGMLNLPDHDAVLLTRRPGHLEVGHALVPVRGDLGALLSQVELPPRLVDHLSEALGDAKSGCLRDHLGFGVRPPPREAMPPLEPAAAARERFFAKLRFSGLTLAPPLAAMALRLSGSIAAKPRRDFGFSFIGSVLPNRVQCPSRY